MRLLAVSQSRGKDVPAMRAERGKLKAKLLVAGASWPRNSGSKGRGAASVAAPWAEAAAPGTEHKVTAHTAPTSTALQVPSLPGHQMGLH